MAGDDILLYKPWRPNVFTKFKTIINVIIFVLLINLNTYDTGLRPLQIFLLLLCKDRL